MEIEQKPLKNIKVTLFLDDESDDNISQDSPPTDPYC